MLIAILPQRVEEDRNWQSIRRRRRSDEFSSGTSKSVDMVQDRRGMRRRERRRGGRSFASKLSSSDHRRRVGSKGRREGGRGGYSAAGIRTAEGKGADPEAEWGHEHPRVVVLTKEKSQRRLKPLLQ